MSANMSTSINIPSFVRPEDLLLDLATKASEISSNEVASPLPPSDELSVTLAGSTKTTSTYEMSLPHEMGAGGVMQCEAHYGTSDEEEIPTSPCSSTAYKRITERYIRRCDETNRPFNRESSIDKSLKRKRTSEDELKGSEGKYWTPWKDESLTGLIKPLRLSSATMKIILSHSRFTTGRFGRF